MLTRLTKGVAARIGAFLAAFALASFVAPPIAVAFVPNPTAAHCLVHPDDEADYNAPGGVSHRGDADHDRHSGNGPDHKSICCGMFGVTALVPDSTIEMIPYWTDPFSMFIEANFHALAPEQPDRPPISRP
jgi:hypothetical protein